MYKVVAILALPGLLATSLSSISSELGTREVLTTAASAVSDVPVTAVAVDGIGNSDGYHVRVIGGSSAGSTWQDIALIKPANLDQTTWYGYQCLTDNGKYVAVAILPATGENIAKQRYAGAYAYAVDVATKVVTPLASGVGSFYFSPACGTDESATFTSSLGESQQLTEVTQFDLTTGKQIGTSIVKGQVTSTVAVGGKLVGALRGDLVALGRGGTTKSPANVSALVHLGSPAYDLESSNDGGIDFLTRDGTGTSRIWHYRSGTPHEYGKGPTSSVQLFAGRGGATAVAGATTLSPGASFRGVDTSPLPAGLTTVSLDGKSAFGPFPGSPATSSTSDVTDRSASGSQVAVAESIPGRTVAPAKFLTSAGKSTRSTSPQLPGTMTGVAETSTVEPERQAEVHTGPMTRVATATFTSATDIKALPALSPGATTPTCAVARLAPTLQAMQPGNAQVSWAIEMAEQGYLTGTSSTRPSNFANMGLAAYSPSADFPPITLVHPSGSTQTTVPRSVMEAIVAQESNFNQASWHALPGIAGDPLIADYYGSGGTITTINYPNADCGYGLAQVTTGMHATDTAITYHGQEKIAVDYQENVAEGLRILESTWNQLYTAGITANGGDPRFLENWYFAVWAYNSGIQPTAAFGNTTGCTPSPTCTGPDGTWGLGWSNNPANPSYNPTRSPYLKLSYADAAHPSSWPYEERIMGWIGSPIVRYGFTAYTPPTFHDTSLWLETAPYTEFCATSMNCNPTTSTCSLADSECWWHTPITWIADCSTSCTTSAYTVGSGSTEPSYTPPATRPVTKTCAIDPAVIPASAIIVDDLATPGQNLAGCSGSAWSNGGTFSMTYGQNGSGDPIGSIDLHQLGAGLGGHMYFSHTEPAASTSLIDTGKWAPTLPSTQYYKIKVHLPATGAVATDATYTVDPGSGGTQTAVRVNQDWGSEQWVTIGTFGMGSGGSLTLTNASALTAGKYDVAWDAAAFIPMGGTPGIPIGGATHVIDAPAGSNPAWVQCGCGTRTAGDPVNTSTGYFGQSSTDVSTTGIGLPFAVTRTYSSALADPAGPNGSAAVSGAFGAGWTNNFGMTATTDGSGNVTVLQEDGSRIVFALSGGIYTPPSPRFNATLSKSGSSYTFSRRGSSYFVFDVVTGRLTSEYDMAGWNAAPKYGNSLAYDASGNLATATDAGGRIYTFTWTTGHITKVATSGGQEVDYGYTSGRLTDVFGIGTSRPGGVNGDQDHLQYSYTTSGLLSSFRTAANYGKTGTPTPVTSMLYDSAERVTSQTDPMGNVTTFVYGPDSGTGITAGQTLVTDGAGHKTLLTYANGLLTNEVKGYGTAVAATWSYTYDPVSLGVTKQTNPDGGIETFAYDDGGDRISASDPLGRTTLSSYDSSGHLLQKTTPDLIQTTHTYSAAGALLTTTVSLPGQSAESSSSNPSPTVVRGDSATYSDAAHPSEANTSTDFDGNQTTYTYDAAGDVASIKDAAGNISNFGYAIALGLRTSAVSARGVAAGTTTSCVPPAVGCTSYLYDAMNRLKSVTDPLGHVTSQTFDADGDLLVSTDANSHPTTKGYDNDDRAISMVSPTGNVTTTYFGDGTIHTKSDKGGHFTTYAYDAQGRVTTSTDPNSKVTQYSYDPNGRQATATDPNGTVAHNTWDVAGQLSSTTYTGTLASPSVSFTYDLGGRRLTMADGSGTSAYGYDTFGELISTVDGAGNVTGYSYDAQGNRTAIQYPGTGNTVTQSWNNLNQLSGVTDAASRTTSFAYDGDGRLSSINYPNSTVATESYNNANQETGVGLAKGATGLASIAYGRDNVGNETSFTPTSGALGVAATYTYDNSNQLNGLTVAGTTTPNTYDAAGNTTGLSGVTQAFDSADRICWSKSGTVSSPTCASPPTGATTYTMSNSGQRTAATPSTGTATSYGWNGAGDLTSVAGAVAASYVYNGDGLRTSKTTGGATTHYVWSVGGTVPVMLTDGTTFYIYGPNGVPIEQTTTGAAAPAWYLSDAQGSTIALIDSAGTVTGRYAYSAWGSATSHSGASSTPLQFNGQYVDAETGFIYLRARYYDPSTSLFLSADPAIAITLAAYGYASNNPLSNFDPLGLWDGWDTLAAIGIGLAVVALAATGVGLIADAALIGGVVAAESVATVTAVSSAAAYTTIGASAIGFGLDTASCVNGDQLGCSGMIANTVAGGLGGVGVAATAAGVEGAGIAVVPFGLFAGGVDVAGGLNTISEDGRRYCEGLSETLRKNL